MSNVSNIAKPNVRKEIMERLRSLTVEKRQTVLDKIVSIYCLSCAEVLDDEGVCQKCDDEDDDDFEDEDSDDEEGDDSDPDEEDEEDEDDAEAEPS